jgi:biopolymer transport protein ExbD
MVDVFTVLLVFLLKSYSADSTLAPPAPLNLPASTAMTTSEISLTITVTEKALFLDKTRIEDPALLSANRPDIPGLQDALAALLPNASNPSNHDLRKVTILGDRNIPYSLLKKVIFTCSQAGIQDIQLAVLQKVGGG